MRALSSSSPTLQGKLLDDYLLGEVLGQGSFGIVYACRSLRSNEERAVKMVDKVETPAQQIKQEVELQQGLYHPNIARVFHVYYERCFVCIVMELCRGGDLIEGIECHLDACGSLVSEEAVHVTRQMAAAIRFLHEKRIVHRDIKGDNFLLDRAQLADPDCRILLTDFGAACVMPRGERLTEKAGTRSHWAPELFASSYGLKADVWALGVVTYGLYEGKLPVCGQAGVGEDELDFSADTPEECAHFVRCLLSADEADRPAAEQLLMHPWLRVRQPAEVPPKRKPPVFDAELLDVVGLPPNFGGVPPFPSAGGSAAGSLVASRAGSKTNPSKEVLKRDRANVVVNERRTELITRMQHAARLSRAAPNSVEGYSTISSDSPESTPSYWEPAFDLTDFKRGSLRSFEWWPPEQVAAESVLYMEGSEARKDSWSSKTFSLTSPTHGTHGLSPMSQSPTSVKSRSSARFSAASASSPMSLSAPVLHVNSSFSVSSVGSMPEETTAEMVSRMLSEYGISHDDWGTREAKTLEEFSDEVQRGTSRLMLDATQHQKLVRVVDLVMVRISSGSGKEERILVEKEQTYADGRSVKDLDRLPGAKKESHENTKQVVERIILEQLRLDVGGIRFNFRQTILYEKEKDSVAFPGVPTVYRTEIVRGQVLQPPAPSAPAEEGAGDGGGGAFEDMRSEDLSKTSRRFRWHTREECDALGVELEAPVAATDFSGLVQVPVSFDTETLRTLLESGGVDYTRFGEGGGTKSLDDLAAELIKGHSVLMRKRGNRIVRVVDMVILQLQKEDSGEVLVEVSEEFADGEVRRKKMLPGEKRRPDENPFLCAHRVLTSGLRFDENAVDLDKDDVNTVEELADSRTYPGLRTVYRKRLIKGRVQHPRDFDLCSRLESRKVLSTATSATAFLRSNSSASGAPSLASASAPSAPSAASAALAASAPTSAPSAPSAPTSAASAPSAPSAAPAPAGGEEEMGPTSTAMESRHGSKLSVGSAEFGEEPRPDACSQQLRRLFEGLQKPGSERVDQAALALVVQEFANAGEALHVEVSRSSPVSSPSSSSAGAAGRTFGRRRSFGSLADLQGLGPEETVSWQEFDRTLQPLVEPFGARKLKQVVDAIMHGLEARSSGSLFPR